LLQPLIGTDKLNHNSARTWRMKQSNTYKRHCFPPAIIQYAVWLKHRFNLSYRDTEDLLAERSISVSYEAIRLWCNKFGPK
jgi:transposase-like protein